MRLLFTDHTEMAYTARTPREAPLGGSQSALCYLAEALANKGHDVIMFNATREAGVFQGVACQPVERLTRDLIARLAPDVVVTLNAAAALPALRPWLPARTRLVLWTQHDIDQPAIAGLADAGTACAADAIVFVSDWQRQRYRERFNLDHIASVVLRNAISPAFEDLFSVDRPILAAKSQSPTLVYTSAPFRGLDVLLAVFPLILHRVPTARLRVFSSLKVYQTSEADDQARHGDLYAGLQATPGIELLGSRSQSELARELAGAWMLAYPNTFPETSCIAVMEALAAGCSVVTSRLGALPETAGGFGGLIPFDQSLEDFAVSFAETVIAEIRRSIESPDEVETERRRQVEAILSHATWAHRAEEWETWLGSLIAS